MLHARRAFQIHEFTDMREVARKLVETTWTLCSGFKCDGLILVNDSTSENGAQEYAVFHGEQQIESLTVSWMESADQLYEILEKLSKDPKSGVRMGKHKLLTHPDGESCRYCA